MRSLFGIAGLLLVCAAPASPASVSAAEMEVDLELVLAVDISYSMDFDELALQRDGYISAMTSKEVLDAIKDGPTGKIAVAYVEWAGSQQVRLSVGWHVIDGPKSAESFASKLAEIPLQRAYRTSISSALAFSAPLFDDNGFKGARRVIDVSGDGVNNQGPPVTVTRDEVVARGIVINGLPVMIKPPSNYSMDLPNLDEYYRDCVIGGPGAFMIPATSRETFKEAIRTKLVLEIAGIVPEPRVIPAQAGPTVSCTIGENMWGRRYGGYGGYGGN